MNYRCFPVGALATNCYLLWDQQGNALLIDPGDNASALLQSLKAEGLTLRAILLTHVHFDHMLAIPELQKATGAPLWVPHADAAAINDPTVSLSSWMQGPPPVFPTPERTFEEGDVLSVGDLSLTVLHTPGHTLGSSCFLAEDLLFSGDTLFAESVGRTDFPGGNFQVLMQSLQRLLALPPETTVLPGHEEPTTIGHEQQYNPYIRRM